MAEFNGNGHEDRDPSELLQGALTVRDAERGRRLERVFSPRWRRRTELSSLDVHLFERSTSGLEEVATDVALRLCNWYFYTGMLAVI